MNLPLPAGFTETELLLALAIMVFAAAVQGSAGLGQSLVAAPILALFEPRFVPGTAAGAAVVAAAPASQIALPTALLVLLAVGLSAVSSPFVASPAALVAAGAASGFMGTASSIGGPPIALVYQHEAGARLRGTLSAFFVIGGSISLLTLAYVSRFGPDEWILSAAILPAVAAGFAASIWTAPILDRGYTRPAVLALSALAAVLVIVKHFAA